MTPPMTAKRYVDDDDDDDDDGVGDGGSSGYTSENEKIKGCKHTHIQVKMRESHRTQTVSLARIHSYIQGHMHT